jgi:hypothetical protein
MAVIVAPAWGAPQQEDALPEPTEQATTAEPWRKLPPPLGQITGNFDALEETGYFRIVQGEYGRTRQLREPAMIWTVEVVKPLTCGHATILLDRLSDVRFYRVYEDGYRQQLLTTVLYHSSWIEQGAVSHEILGRDEQFEVWVLLNTRQQFLLEHEGANEVVFSQPRERKAGHKGLWRETRRYRLPEAYSRIPHRAVGTP